MKIFIGKAIDLTIVEPILNTSAATAHQPRPSRANGQQRDDYPGCARDSTGEGHAKTGSGSSSKRRPGAQLGRLDPQGSDGGKHPLPGADTPDLFGESDGLSANRD